jgi:hypothetical protein
MASLSGGLGMVLVTSMATTTASACRFEIGAAAGSRERRNHALRQSRLFSASQYSWQKLPLPREDVLLDLRAARRPHRLISTPGCNKRGARQM